MTRKKRKDTLRVGYHVVAFLDLMGQQEALRNLSSLPNKDNPDEYQEFIENLKNTYGAVSFMRSIFKDNFNYFKKKQKPPKGLSKPKLQIYKQLTSTPPIHIHQFSDFTTASVSLDSGQNARVPIKGVYSIFASATLTSLACLAKGTPIRGGIDVGVGINIEDGEVYGAPIARAYTLESHIANYPRIVIGDELIRYLNESKNKPRTDEASTLSALLAKECLSMLYIDSDGHFAIDFMGESVKKMMDEGKEDFELIHLAYDFVNKQSAKFKQDKNSKLAFKYSLLRNYMESRFYLWK
jgi:hypothetical protein